jgi:hypothetical protein
VEQARQEKRVLKEKKVKKNEKKRKENMKSIKCKENFQVINFQGEEKVEE